MKNELSRKERIVLGVSVGIVAVFLLQFKEEIRGLVNFVGGWPGFAMYLLLFMAIGVPLVLVVLYIYQRVDACRKERSR